MGKSIESIEEIVERCWDSMVSSPFETLSELDDLVSELPETHTEFKRASFYKIYCYIYTGEFATAADGFCKLLESAEAENDEVQIRRVSNALGSAYKSLGDYGSAVQCFERAIELSIKQKFSHGEVSARLNIVGLYYEIQDFAECEYHTKLLMNIDLEEDNEELRGDSLHIQAKMHLVSYDFNRAIKAIEETLIISEELDYSHLRIQTLILKGRWYRLQGVFDKAESIFVDVIHDPYFVRERAVGMTVYIELAKSLIAHSEHETAFSYLTEAIKLIHQEASEHVLLRLQAYELITMCYGKTDQMEQAFHYAKLTLEMERSFISMKNNRISGVENRRREQERQRIKQEQIELDNEVLRKSRSQLQIVNRLAEELTSTLDMKTLGERLYNISNKYLNAHFILLSENVESEKLVKFLCIINEGVQQPSLSLKYDDETSKTILAIKTKKYVLVSEKENNRVITSGILIPRSQLFVPLMQGDKVIGVFSIQSDIENRFTGDDLNLILSLSPFISLALSNVLSHENERKLSAEIFREKKVIEEAQEKIHFMAHHDALTELPNRRALEEHLEQRAKVKFDFKKPFSLVYIDLDGFKPANDVYGHLVGDEVLKVVSKRISRMLRSSDFASRVGGDEFILVFGYVENKEQREAMVHRVLKAIEKPIGIDEHRLNISASIGVVPYSEKTSTLDDLVHHADRAMYEVKRAGKGGIKFISAEDIE